VEMLQMGPQVNLLRVSIDCCRTGCTTQ